MDNHTVPTNSMQATPSQDEVSERQQHTPQRLHPAVNNSHHFRQSNPGLFDFVQGNAFPLYTVQKLNPTKEFVDMLIDGDGG
ncbi:13509_t:CDS:1, partial [Acaulospora morrowiae]